MTGDQSSLNDINKASDNFERLNEIILSLQVRISRSPLHKRTELNKNLLLAQGSYVHKLTELTILKAKLGIVNKTWYKKGE